MMNPFLIEMAERKRSLSKDSHSSDGDRKSRKRHSADSPKIELRLLIESKVHSFFCILWQ